jgi:hypothetical protein
MNQTRKAGERTIIYSSVSVGRDDTNELLQGKVEEIEQRSK